MSILRHPSSSRNVAPEMALTRATVTHVSGLDGAWWTAAPHAVEGDVVALRVPSDSAVVEYARAHGRVHCLALMEGVWCELACRADVRDDIRLDGLIELWLAPLEDAAPVQDEPAIVPRT